MTLLLRLLGEESGFAGEPWEPYSHPRGKLRIQTVCMFVKGALPVAA